ncbi:Rieske ISP assembly ATPase [Schizosaccharomyces japonicus yFS275]|uniref:Rieske ISP assembly ATPase n=1 Tax=Schizosaccharomyces japonicus (strain yFS275 / FY16936) TaxID=402676 RepID=B6JXU2_SCHJY|nr:Rieske ISP assembly ATPase [Schizosaccharomyces japonicus yFS275]EEB06360.1 Rieske ISP assembly ATPase [Schizosaccharomyces japonicus yFS275]
MQQGTPQSAPSGIPHDITSPPSPPGRFQAFLSDNSIFSAGLGLMSLGAGLAILRRSIVAGASAMKRRMLVSLEIPSKDRSYAAFLRWMANVPRRYSHNLAVETSAASLDTVQAAGSAKNKANRLFGIVPGPGRHYIKYQGCWIQIERQRSGRLQDLTTGTPWETVTLTTLNRDRGVFSQLLAEAQAYTQSAKANKTIIYTAFAAEWRPFGRPRSKRLLSTVVLDTGVKEKLVADLREFLQNSKWYAERGIPYRRGYLLYGPPGSGKTSFLFALAGELDYDICVINLAERGLSDDRLNHLLSNLPPRSVVLLEDVDSAFGGRKITDEMGFQSAVTFSGLLNALDGVASSEERIVFMTTNHPERLDAALIRPGRVDYKAYFGNASPKQVRELFSRFYRADKKLADELCALVCPKQVSMAYLQEIFVANKSSPEAALAMAKQRLQTSQKSSS